MGKRIPVCNAQKRMGVTRLKNKMEKEISLFEFYNENKVCYFYFPQVICMEKHKNKEIVQKVYAGFKAKDLPTRIPLVLNLIEH